MTLPKDFMACVAAAAEAMNEPLNSFLGLLAEVRFSSTIATNAVVQRSGHRVGLIVSKGGENAYATPAEFKSLNAFIDPEFVVAVGESVSDSGKVEQAPDPGEIDNAVRLLLERGVARAVELGLPIAALKLGETHDPKEFDSFKVLVLKHEPAEARRWYERAVELGVPEAEARLRRLGSR